MTEIRVEAEGSGQAPVIRTMAIAFRDWMKEARNDPEIEADYQAWLKEYRKRKEG